MALTKISEGGFKDDATSQAKIADEAVDEARLQISNAGSNGEFLQKQSGNTGGLTWAAPGGGMWKKMAGADVAAGTSSSDYDIFTDFASHTDKKWWKLVFRLECPSGSNDFSGSGLRVKIGGSWKTSDYAWQLFYVESTNELASKQTSQSRFSFTNNDEKWHRGEVTFYDPNATDIYKIFEYTGISADHNWHTSSDNPFVERSAGGYVGGTEAIQGIRFNHYGNTWGKIHFALFAGDGW